MAGVDDLETLLADLGDGGEVGSYEVDVDVNLDDGADMSDHDLLAELSGGAPSGSHDLKEAGQTGDFSDDEGSGFGLKLETGDTAHISGGKARADSSSSEDGSSAHQVADDWEEGEVTVVEAIEPSPVEITMTTPASTPSPVLLTFEVPSRSPSFAAPSTTTTTIITTTTTGSPAPSTPSAVITTTEEPAAIKVLRAPSVTYTPPMPVTITAPKTTTVKTSSTPQYAVRDHRSAAQPPPAQSQPRTTVISTGGTSVFTPSLPVYSSGSGSSSSSSPSGFSVPLSTGSNATYNYNTTSPGVTTVMRIDAPSGFCDTCHQTISPSQSQLKALGKVYHKDHFVCRKCNTQIGDQSFVPLAGQPYCQACYGSQDAPTCDRCKNTITRGTSFLRALGHVYHPNCFTCIRCSTRLNPEQFYVKDNTKATCKNCYSLV